MTIVKKQVAFEVEADLSASGLERLTNRDIQPDELPGKATSSVALQDVSESMFLNVRQVLDTPGSATALVDDPLWRLQFASDHDLRVSPSVCHIRTPGGKQPHRERKDSELHQ